MSIFIYIYTYYVRNAELVCTAQTFSKIWIHSTPTLPWRFALAPQPLPACKAPWDISNQLCLGGDCERNTWPWNFRVCHQFILHNSTFETKRMCYYIWHELTFSVVKNFMFNFSIQSPKYHTVGLLVEKKKSSTAQFYPRYFFYTVYYVYYITYWFPQVAWFHPNPSSSPGHWCPPAPRWARRAGAASRGHRSPWAAESWTKLVNHPWTNRSVLF